MISTDKAQNPARQIEPQEVQKRIEELRLRAEEARKEMLQGVLADALEEARVYRQRRDELAKTSPDDPRLAVLDARILGAERLAQFASGGKGGTTKPLASTAVARKAKKRSGKP